jgi:dihydrofolate reductase
MARIVITEFVSLDGVMEDPGGSEGSKLGPWTFQFDRGEEGDRFKVDELNASDAMLLGRVTYQGFAKAWPSRSGDLFSDKMNSMRKYVISSTLPGAEATWNNTEVLRGDLADEVAKLKALPGGDVIVPGSATLAQSLVRAGLVDELHLMLFPIILGTGKRLFGETALPAKLELTSSETLPSGILLLTYRPATAA